MIYMLTQDKIDPNNRITFYFITNLQLKANYLLQQTNPHKIKHSFLAVIIQSVKLKILVSTY